jgi:hypothetical protein
MEMEIVILVSVFLMLGCYLSIKGESIICKGFGATIIAMSAIMFSNLYFTLIEFVGL